MISNLRRIEQTERTIKANHERLQRLSRQLVMAQESENRHIARELHDHVGQMLTVVKLNLQTMERIQQIDEMRDQISTSLSIVDRALEQVRSYVVELLPAVLDDLGLVAALRWLLDRFSRQAKVAVECIADPPQIVLPQEVEITCFRVAQEALTNIMRHARATRVRIDVYRHSEELELRITDDGVGFDPTAARESAVRGSSVGLLGMEERIKLIDGQFHIDSATNQGTVICARFPLPPVDTPESERVDRRRSDRRVASRRTKARHC
jgi:signal transduction histidine kinase